MANLAIYIFILAALFVGTCIRPAIALASLLCVQVLDFWGQLASPLLYQYGLFTNVFMVALIVLGIFRAQHLTTRRYHVVPWVQIGICSLLIYAAISLLWSPAFKDGIEQWNTHWPYMILNVLLTPLLFRRDTDLYYGLCAVLVLGTALAILVDLFVQWDARFIVSFWDPNKKLWNALAFAQMAGYVTLAAVLLNHDKRWQWSAIRYVGVAASIVLVVKSETRGQFLLMIVLPIIFVPFSRPVSGIKTYISWGILAACLAVGAIYAYDSFTQHEERWSSRTVQSDGDLRIYKSTVLLEHWWRASERDPSVFVLGLGNSAAFSSKIAGYYPHMVPLEVLGEEGLIGSGILLLLLWATWRTMRKAYSLAKHDSAQRGIVTTLAASFFFAFLLSLKQGSLVGYGPAIFSFIVLLERQVAILEAEKCERLGCQQLQPAIHFTDADLAGAG